jgi:hypothetical protein
MRLAPGVADVLVDRKCLLQAGGAFLGVAVVEVGLADAFQGAYLRQSRTFATMPACADRPVRRPIDEVRPEVGLRRRTAALDRQGWPARITVRDGCSVAPCACRIGTA